MSVTRAQVKAFGESQKFGGAEQPRLALSIDDAVELAKQLTSEELRHAEKVVGAVTEFDLLRETKEPTDIDGKVKFYSAHGRVAEAFWDGFEQQSVEGVEILRRR